MDAARRLGFAFVSRSMTHITLSMLGEEVCYEILNVFEFSSERGRMGVVAKAPDGEFCDMVPFLFFMGGDVVA